MFSWFLIYLMREGKYENWEEVVRMRMGVLYPSMSIHIRIILVSAPSDVLRFTIRGCKAYYSCLARDTSNQDTIEKSLQYDVLKKITY